MRPYSSTSWKIAYNKKIQGCNIKNYRSLCPLIVGIYLILMHGDYFLRKICGEITKPVTLNDEAIFYTFICIPTSYLLSYDELVGLFLSSWYYCITLSFLFI